METAEPISTAGSKTLLVVEDEPLVRSLAVRALVGQGYRVLQASDAPAALVLSRGYDGEINLLITDVVMPGMNGKELADLLAAERPGLRVLYVSGYTDDEVLQRGVSGREVEFMRKPFAAEALVRRVRALLDDARG